MNCHVNDISWPLLEGYMIQAILISWCCSGLPLPHLAQDATALHPRTEDLAPWEASASSGWWLSPQEKGESQSCFIPKIRVNYLGIIIYPSSCPFQPNIQVLIWLIDLYIYIYISIARGWTCKKKLKPPIRRLVEVLAADTSFHQHPTIVQTWQKNQEKTWKNHGTPIDSHVFWNLWPQIRG